MENPQQLPVTIYDYYDPGKHMSHRESPLLIERPLNLIVYHLTTGQTLTKYFLPSTSAALPTMTTTRPGPRTFHIQT